NVTGPSCPVASPPVLTTTSFQVPPGTVPNNSPKGSSGASRGATTLLVNAYSVTAPGGSVAPALSSQVVPAKTLWLCPPLPLESVSVTPPGETRKTFRLTGSLCVMTVLSVI